MTTKSKRISRSRDNIMASHTTSLTSVTPHDSSPHPVAAVAGLTTSALLSIKPFRIWRFSRGESKKMGIISKEE